MALLDVPARLWTIARKVEDLIAFQGSTKGSLEELNGRLRAIEDRMTRLEANQTQLIVEARSAASAAATSVAGAVLSDVVTRITRIEMRARPAISDGR